LREYDEIDKFKIILQHGYSILVYLAS
jgi:hypothetical protein